MADWLPVNEGRPVALSDLAQVARELAAAGEAANIWRLEGEMGAGKTTLIGLLAKNMGIADTVSSPTFSFINEYETADGERVYHFDFYRLKNTQEAYDMGVDEYFLGHNKCWVEWPDKVQDLLPPDCFTVRIDHVDEQHRHITYR